MMNEERMYDCPDDELCVSDIERFRQDAISRNRRIDLVERIMGGMTEQEALRELTRFQYTEIYETLEKISTSTNEPNDELNYWLKYSRHRMNMP